MKYFHGSKRRFPYFEGWYLKHQSKSGKGLALIPAYHLDGAGHGNASLQVISDCGSWWLPYPQTQFQACEDSFRVRLGQTVFEDRGMEVNINRDGLLLRGKLNYGPFTPLRSDIMGPFRFFADMQCAHGVISMGHRLEGAINLNGETIDFGGGTGYIETDRGRSFPDAYLWTQCTWDGPKGGSLMLAIATVPLPVGGFTGCICAVVYRGREYRLATYRGAKPETWSPLGASIRQGRYRLTVRLLEERSRPLRAPVSGSMARTIHESLCAEAEYCFWDGEDLVFRHTDRCAGFEYSDQNHGS